MNVTYTLSSSALLGDWTYGVYVYRGSTLLDQVTGQGFTVQPAVKSGEILSVTADPDPVGQGGATAFTVTFENTGNVVWSTAKLTAKIYKPGSTSVYTTKSLSISNIAPGVEYTYNVKWAVSSYADGGNLHLRCLLLLWNQHLDGQRRGQPIKQHHNQLIPRLAIIDPSKGLCPLRNEAERRRGENHCNLHKFCTVGSPLLEW